MTERRRGGGMAASARAVAPPSESADRCAPAADGARGSDLRRGRYRAFIKELQTGSGLREASLRDCELHRTNIRELGDALFLHPTLTAVSFHGCRIGDAAASLVTALLRSHPSLTFADFSNNNISKSGVQEILTALESNISVTHLDVSTESEASAGGLLLRFSSSSPPTQEQLSRIKALCEANIELRTSLRDTRSRAVLRRRNLAVLPGALLEWFNLVSLDVRPSPHPSPRCAAHAPRSCQTTASLRFHPPC